MRLDTLFLLYKTHWIILIRIYLHNSGIIICCILLILVYFFHAYGHSCYNASQLSKRLLRGSWKSHSLDWLKASTGSPDDTWLRQGKTPTRICGFSQTRLPEGIHRIIWYHWAACVHTVCAAKGINRTTRHLEPFLMPCCTGRGKHAWGSLRPKSLACVKASTRLPHTRGLRSIKDTQRTGWVLLV